MPPDTDKNLGTVLLPRLGRTAKIGIRLLSGLIFTGLALWSTLAVYYSNLPARWMRALASIVYLVALLSVLIRVRPWWLNRLVRLAAFALVLVWFLLTPPSNDRDWQPDVSLLPWAEVDGQRVTIHNIRNCDYRSETDYTLKYYDKEFDVAKMRSVDLYVCCWGLPLVAHTMLSFGFEGGDYLCFSIEARKERGEGYSPVKAFFRQYELIYLIGDERDLVRLRTNYRGEKVYLYRLNKDLAVARQVFLEYMKQVNWHKERAEWYNVLTANCTTLLRGHARPYLKNPQFDWRILCNGRIDELAYQRKTLDQTLPFAELKARSLINDRAKAADKDPQFSRRIREQLPGMLTSLDPDRDNPAKTNMER
jgi:hypothetical protein